MKYSSRRARHSVALWKCVELMQSITGAATTMAAQSPIQKDSGYEFAFASFGVRIGIWLEDPAWLPGVEECLPPGWVPIASEGLDRCYRLQLSASDEKVRLPSGVRLTMNGELAAWAPTPESILDALESQLQIYVAEFSDPALFVHAGVVRWHDVTIMLPGSSFAGKSTLVTALVEAGAIYYSDEYAVLDREGLVRPYPRRLSLREGPFGPAQRIDLAKHACCQEDGDEALPVDIVLFATYEDGRHWSCQRLDHGAAILALCEHTVAIQRRPADALAILAKIAENASVYKGVRGDLHSAIRWLDEMAARPVAMS